MWNVPVHVHAHAHVAAHVHVDVHVQLSSVHVAVHDCMRMWLTGCGSACAFVCELQLATKVCSTVVDTPWPIRMNLATYGFFCPIVTQPIMGL